MAQDDKPDTVDKKIDALAAMAGGRDIAHEGFNAPEIVADSDQDRPSNAASALAAQTASIEANLQPVDLSGDAPTPNAAPAFGAAPTPGAAPTSSAAVSGARKSRANALQRQRSQSNGEQFKRMMIPILLITGILLIVLGGLVLFLMQKAPVDPYADPATGLLNNTTLKKIMVIASFPIGGILIIGAWLFHAEIKRGQAAIKKANAKNDE